MDTAEKQAMVELLRPLIPFKGTAKDIGEKIGWEASVAQLSAQMRAARPHLEASGISIKRSSRTNDGLYTWNITSTEPRVLFDSRAYQPMKEDTMARELDLTNEGQPNLGIKLVWEVSEGALQAFFAMLPYLKADGLAQQIATHLKSGNHNTVKGVFDKHISITQSLFTKPENTGKVTASGKKSASVKSINKEKPSLPPKYRLRSTVKNNPDKYVAV